MQKILISACLVGDKVNYEGKGKYCPLVEKLKEKYNKEIKEKVNAETEKQKAKAETDKLKTEKEYADRISEKEMEIER